MAANEAATESEHLQSLITSTASALWEEREALDKFLNVVRHGEAFASLAEVRGPQRSRRSPAEHRVQS